jgi:hypothetical protein
MCRRRRHGLLTNFVTCLTLIPSSPASPAHCSPAHWRWSHAPLDFLHFFHPIGHGPLPHWIFSRPTSLLTNKVHLSQWPLNYITFPVKNRFHLNDIPQMISPLLALARGSQGTKEAPTNHELSNQTLADTNYFI